jgi:maleylpyruvate isomerase
MSMDLYSFFRSGTSHRLRIALNLKGLAYRYRPVDLRKEEHLAPAYRQINPQGFVPALVDGDNVLIQSPAIIEWLEERHPDPPLLPVGADQRARVRALAAIVGCDIHPINNRRVLEHLRRKLGCTEYEVNAWCATWIVSGFDALETLLA